MTAQDYYKKARSDFNLAATEETSKLLNHQSKLEEKLGRASDTNFLHAAKIDIFARKHLVIGILFCVYQHIHIHLYHRHIIGIIHSMQV